LRRNSVFLTGISIFPVIRDIKFISLLCFDLWLPRLIILKAKEGKGKLNTLRPNCKKALVNNFFVLKKVTFYIHDLLSKAGLDFHILGDTLSNKQLQGTYEIIIYIKDKY